MSTTPGGRSGPPPGRGSGSADRAPLVPGGKFPRPPARKNPGPPPGRRSGPVVERPTGPPGYRAPVVPGGRSPGPLSGRGVGLPGTGSGSSGGRGSGLAARRRELPSPEKSAQALEEINHCISECDRVAALLIAEPTGENVSNIQKLIFLIRRMMTLMNEFGPSSGEESLVGEMEMLALAPDGRPVDAEQRRIEAQFRRDMNGIKNTADMYERALDSAEKRQHNRFRKIMAPIVQAIKGVE
jgi:hypothetical protein